MSFLRGRRGLKEALEESADDGTSASRSRPEGKAAVREARRVTAAVSETLGQALKMLRQVAPGEGDARETLASIEGDVGRAMVAEDYRGATKRLRKVRLPSAVGGVDTLAIGVFHRVVENTLPLAQGLSLRAATEDLRELLRVPVLTTLEDRPVRRLERVFETFAFHASRTREGADVMRACVSELIETLARLGEEESAHGESLVEIKGRLEEAREITDLLALREALLMQADRLVDAASARRQSVRAAFEDARASQERAEALEAALTDVTEQARTDTLTGLGNRRALDEAVARLDGRTDVAVLALDLDHFKTVNDTHGHAVGDQVLRLLGEILRGELRGEDRAFRVGGEEFIVLLPQGTWQGARATGERLRIRVGRQPVPTGGDAHLRVTCSVGVALWASGESFESAQQSADAALYRAKRNGRNRVVG